MLIAAVLLAGAAAPAGDVARMIALYDRVCLRAFPDDAKIEAAMVAANATPLTEDQARVTLRDDPGRGWVVTGDGAPVMVMLELPPVHACSVRALVGDGPHDLTGLQASVAAYKASHPGFAAQPPFDGERAGIRIHAESAVRLLAGGAAESLMVIEQHVTEATQLGPGETAAPLRFVHQIRAAQ